MRDPGELDLTDLEHTLQDLDRLKRERDHRLKTVGLDAEDLIPRLKEAGFILISNGNPGNTLIPRAKDLPGSRKL